MADREKVMKGLECCTHGIYKCSICPYDPRNNALPFDCVTELAKGALELLKAQGWISVEDRLPENIKPVLVWESQGFAYVDNCLDGAWLIGSDNGANITHWMPLPEPPKEETK